MICISWLKEMLMVNHLVIGTEMDQVLKMEISMNTIGVESLISHLN